jgi:hypothetical protein
VLFDPWNRDPDPGMEKIEGQNSGSGMNIPNIIFENLVADFWVKILKIFDADPDLGSYQHPGSSMGKNRIRNPG